MPLSLEDIKMAGLKIVKNAKQKTADIWIYQDIGDGWFEGFTAKHFAEEMKALSDVEVLNVFINSPGGDVFDGVAIYNILKRHKAKVVVEIDALAASIASVIAMAGNEIRMAENALMMIHNPWGFVMGGSSDMRKAAEDMDKIRDSSIVPAYVKQTGMEEAQIVELMDAETWMNAAEAKEYGFIDEITAEKKMAAYIDPKKYNKVFKSIPEAVNPEDKAEDKIEDEPKEVEKKVLPFPVRNSWEQKIAER